MANDLFSGKKPAADLAQGEGLASLSTDRARLLFDPTNLEQPRANGVTLLSEAPEIAELHNSLATKYREEPLTQTCMVIPHGKTRLTEYPSYEVPHYANNEEGLDQVNFREISPLTTYRTTGGEIINTRGSVANNTTTGKSTEGQEQRPMPTQISYN